MSALFLSLNKKFAYHKKYGENISEIALNVIFLLRNEKVTLWKKVIQQFHFIYYNEIITWAAYVKIIYFKVLFKSAHA